MVGKTGKLKHTYLSMPSKTPKTALVIIPPEDIRMPIQNLRQIHDPHYRRWMPHITLLYPFRLKGEFEKLAPQFSAELQNFPPFEMTFSQFCYFPPVREKYTLWLAPEPAEKVDQLQETLLKVTPDCDDTRNFPNGFTPHLSVGSVRGKDKLLELRDTLQADWQPLRFTLNRVCLIWRNNPPDDIFREGVGIRLKN
jgi:2'-5' RNA ligase